MKGSFVLGSIKGIRIKSDFGCVLILGLFASLLAAIYFPHTYPAWTPPVRWTVALVISFMLFISVLLHELSHALVSANFGMPVKEISLFIFGGMTRIESIPDRPVMDIQMALSGPAMNLFLYLFLLLGAKILGLFHVPEAITLSLVYSAQANIILLIFNLVPVFPLDGGRVLRALIWHFKKDFQWATKIAANAGNGFGYIMIIFGLYLIPAGEYLFAVWFVLNGWYIHRLSQSGY